VTFNPTILLVTCAALAACASPPSLAVLPAKAHGPISPYLPYSKECLAAEGFVSIVCKGCGPSLCWLLMQGCVLPDFCTSAEQALKRDIEPCGYLTLADLYPDAECQRLGKEMQLLSTAVPPSSWRPSPCEYYH
jgi:hypothetical protein